MSTDITDKETEAEKKIGQNQYLLFYAGGDIYAIEALTTSEIVEYSHTTKVPVMPSFVRGVTNIRGNIVPVIDLLDRFGLGKSEINPKTSIVVMNYKINDRVIQIGIIIDEVYEVDDIYTQQIKEAPEFGAKVDKRFILRMGKYQGNYIAILNTQTILDVNELSKLAG